MTTPPEDLCLPLSDVANRQANATEPAPRELGREQAGVVTRRQLIEAGVPRWFVRNELLCRRWRPFGRQVIALHSGPLLGEARRWAAVLDAGPRSRLDGITALQHLGLRGIEEDLCRVSVPQGSRPGRWSGATVRETRGWRKGDELTFDGLPCLRAHVAAAHAALWARSDRQGRLFLVMAVQQRLTTTRAIAEVLARHPRSSRRRALLAVLSDVERGSESLGALDVVVALRRRGLPIPDQQVVCRRPDSSEFLDCRFTEYGVVLEIDGAQPRWEPQALTDVLRDLNLAVEDQQVVRVPLLGWYLDSDAVLDTVAGLLQVRGWLASAA